MYLSLESAWPDKANSPQTGFPGGADCRKTYITKRVVRPTPYKPEKPRAVWWDFCTSQGASVRQRRAYSPLQKLEKVA